MKALLVAVAVLAGASGLRGDYLEVWKPTALHASASASADVVVNVGEGTLLKLDSSIGPTRTFYAASTADGLVGFVPRSHVRRHPGNPPVPGSANHECWVDLGDALSPQEIAEARRHYAIGKPQAAIQRVHEGYALVHDSRLKIPLWVQYQLSREDLVSHAQRTNDYRADSFLPRGSRAELADYAKSGFERGHLAPSADMERSQTVVSESFLLSNFTPQVGDGFNRGPWGELEDAVRGWVERRGTLTIIVGPVFMPANGTVSYTVIGKDNVAVPTHLFKVVVDAQRPDHVEALAFLIPNLKNESSDLRQFLVSIDEIERLTGLDLLSALPTEVQAKVEAKPAPDLW